MVDQIIGLILLGLGLKAPSSTATVKGDTTTASQALPTSTPDEAQEGTNAAEADQTVAVNAREANLRPIFSQKRAEFTASVLQKRQEAVQNRKERRAIFQEKIRQLRDAKKRQIVNRIDSRIQTINENRTDAMSKHLATLSEILEKLVARASDLKSRGVNTAQVDAAITSAQSAVAAAQSAVVSQAGKSYVIALESEETVRSDVAETTQQLRMDIQSAYQTVAAAREKVRAAVAALVQAKQEGK